MPARPIAVRDVPESLALGLERLRAEVEVPDAFPAEALAEAERVSANVSEPGVDRTDIEFCAIDPPGALDVDQIMHIERRDAGFRIRYGIADLGLFVVPGGAVDAEAHRRGQTFYAPHRRVGLHPPVISEDRASLRAGQTRPCVLWTLDLDSSGELTDVHVERASVRSRRQLTYDRAQQEIDDGTASETLRLLAEVGPLRQTIEAERGGVSLEIPDQEVHADGSVWRLAFREPVPVEGWNAQISLLTGIAAAQMMLEARIGIVRTLPPAEESAIRSLRATAAALDIAWPADRTYPEFVRSLDAAKPTHVAMMYACTRLFRGARYHAFDGELPEQTDHAALATPYAHTTAPLRRLVDRYVNEVCLALCSGQEVPMWVRKRLPDLPDTMAASDRRAKKYERGIVDLTEALVLSGRVGQEFDAVVVSVDEERRRGTVLIDDPAVEATLRDVALPLGEHVRVRLDGVDLVEGTADLSPVDERD